MRKFRFKPGREPKNKHLPPPVDNDKEIAKTLARIRKQKEDNREAKPIQ